MATLVFVFKDGEKLESSYAPPYSIREQLDWEEHFRSAFSAIERVMDATRKARLEGHDVDPQEGMRATWILWFGWHRARPKVPAKFDRFVDLLEDWHVEFDADELARLAEANLEDGKDGEPGAAESGGSEIDAAETGNAETDGSLDPTVKTEPSDPAQ